MDDEKRCVVFMCQPEDDRRDDSSQVSSDGKRSRALFEQIVDHTTKEEKFAEKELYNGASNETPDSKSYPTF